MNEVEYLLDIFKPYVKFEKKEDQYHITYQGNLDTALHIGVVITYHIEPNIKMTIEDAIITIDYDKLFNITLVVITIRQNRGYSTIAFDMDTVKEILIETREEFEKRILE